jgi:hypothetical protein
MNRFLHPLTLIAFFLASGLLCAATPTVRILGIGNSFTRNATKYLPSVIKADPEIDAEIALAYIGGSPLDKHVRLATEHEANPKAGCSYDYVKDGKTISKSTSLKHILNDGEWDYITIQQVSSKSYKIETYYPYTEQLIQYVRKYSPDSEIVIHETWEHSIDSHRVKRWNLTPDEMYAKLHAAYGQVAEEFQLDIIPVGTAFNKAKTRPLWDHKAITIDTSTLTEEDPLPDQSKSLHHTFSWRTGKDGKRYLNNDGYHAGKYGEYLGAMVWYEFFFNKDARTVTYIPSGFSEEQARSLQEIAHETMLSN